MIAILAPVLLVVYLLITDFGNLFPLNDVKRHPSKLRKVELLNYLLPLLAAFCSWYDTLATLIIAFIIALVFVVGNALSWWIPYFFGSSAKKKKEMQYKYGRTLKILPRIKDHTIPNLEHTIVTILIWVWFIATLVAL